MKKKLDEVKMIFKDTGINITVDGHKYLGGLLVKKMANRNM